jgi:vacuolar-type H+-ATPase subunit E/Vma4
MESVEQEKAALISGIEADARAEEEKIIKEAQDQAAEKKKYAEKKIEDILAEARTKAKEQSETAKKQIISLADREVKRRYMHIQNVVMNDIMSRVEKKFSEMIGDENYKPILKEWLTEAAIGLDAETATVNASQEELRLIDEVMLSEVAKGYQNRTGKSVTLTLCQDQPLKLQGVILTAADGRTAFNNQVRTRMLRYKRQIQTLIHDKLFADNKKE